MAQLGSAGSNPSPRAGRDRADAMVHLLSAPPALSRRTTVIAFALLATIVLLSLAHHLSWRDEHQAWLIARDSALASIPYSARYEMHPPLWFYLLRFVQALLGTDITALKSLQAVLAVAMLALILFASPFTLGLRNLLALNYFILFEYAVFARPYALSAIVICLALVTWRRPLAWLFLALATQISLHTALLAGALGLYRLITGADATRRNAVIGATLSCLAGLAMLWQIVPPADMVAPAAFDDRTKLILRTVLYAGNLLAPLTPFGGWFFAEHASLAGPIALVAVIATPFVLWSMFPYDVAARAIALIFFAGMAATGWFAYGVATRHMGLAMVLLIALAWIGQTNGQAPARAFTWTAAWLAGMGVIATGLAAGSVFSPSHHAARWIKENGLASAHWAVHPGWNSIDLAAVAGVSSLNLKRGCRETFQLWNVPATAATAEQFADAIAAAARAAGGTLHLLTETDLPPTLLASASIDTLYQSPRAIAFGGAPVRLHRITLSDAARAPAHAWADCPR